MSGDHGVCGSMDPSPFLPWRMRSSGRNSPTLCGSRNGKSCDRNDVPELPLILPEEVFRVVGKEEMRIADIEAGYRFVWLHHGALGSNPSYAANASIAVTICGGYKISGVSWGLWGYLLKSIVLELP